VRGINVGTSNGNSVAAGKDGAVVTGVADGDGVGTTVGVMVGDIVSGATVGGLVTEGKGVAVDGLAVISAGVGGTAIVSIGAGEMSTGAEDVKGALVTLDGDGVCANAA
jgi:hypothetical protein